MQSSPLKTTLYWLIGNQGLKNAIEQSELTQGHIIQGGFALFSQKPLDNHLDLTPWLIPWHDQLTELDSSICNQGILLSSQAGHEQVLTHLQSLLIAYLEFKTVLFRFYDPRVLSPMLKAMSPQRYSAFMGPITQISLSFKGKTQQIINPEPTPPHQPISNEMGWWQIRTQELPYHPELHAQAILRRLWQVLPEMASQVEAPATLTQALANPPAKLAKQDYDLWAIFQLAKQQQMPLDKLNNPLQLSDQNHQQLEQWLKEYPEHV